MEVILAEHAGFCFGVQRAVDTVYEQIEKQKQRGDKAVPIYNKYYKRYAARVRVHQLKKDEFNKWCYQAITKRDECSDGKISPEEYIEWMEAYFPNRKRKSE